MLLKTAVSASSSSSLPLFNAEHSRCSSYLPLRHGKNGFVVCATKGSNNNRALTGVLFEPFEEVKKELDLVPTVPQVSLARHKYHDESEAAVNEQIKFVPLPLLISFLSFHL